MLAVHRVRGTWTHDVNVYVALTSFARHKFIDAGFPEAKILVKPNFVDPDPGSEPGERRFFLFVGRLSEEKGIRTLLRAWVGMDPSRHLRIVGAGPLEPLVREAAGASGAISYLGPLSRAGVFEQMRSAHALLFPSEWYEALPVTLLEAFACGRPVIAADHGAAAEVVTHGVTGLLFPPGDEHALRQQVNWAVDHPDALASMGAEARREYEGRYTAQASYSRLLEIYQLAMCSVTPQPPSSKMGR
jgi:glycosyltransferase involved in cell wall biosynthesis